MLLPWLLVCAEGLKTGQGQLTVRQPAMGMEGACPEVCPRGWTVILSIQGWGGGHGIFKPPLSLGLPNSESVPQTGGSKALADVVKLLC